MTNVTRFGEISPLWQIFEELWQLVKSLFSIWQNQNLLWQNQNLLWQIACAIWLIYIVVNSHNIEKVILASGHTDGDLTPPTHSLNQFVFVFGKVICTASFFSCNNPAKPR